MDKTREAVQELKSKHYPIIPAPLIIWEDDQIKEILPEKMELAMVEIPSEALSHILSVVKILSYVKLLPSKTLLIVSASSFMTRGFMTKALIPIS